MPELPAVIEVANNRHTLFSFRIAGEVSHDDPTALAAYVTEFFDDHDSASERGQALIDVMATVIPVEAETFGDEIAAWCHLNAEAMPV